MKQTINPKIKSTRKQEDNRDYVQIDIYLQFTLFILSCFVDLYCLTVVFTAFTHDAEIKGFICGILFLFMTACVISIGLVYYHHGTFAVSGRKEINKEVNQLHQNPNQNIQQGANYYGQKNGY